MLIQIIYNIESKILHANKFSMTKKINGEKNYEKIFITQWYSVNLSA